MTTKQIESASESTWRRQCLLPALMVACLIFSDRPLVLVVIAQDSSPQPPVGEVQDDSAFDSFNPFDAAEPNDFTNSRAPQNQATVNRAGDVQANPNDSSSTTNSRAPKKSKKDGDDVDDQVNRQVDDSQPLSVRPLSVDPERKSLLPSNSPAWVSQPADYSQKYHRFNVCSTPEKSVEAADLSLDFALVFAVRQYIDQRVLNENEAAKNLPISAKYIRQNLIDKPSGYIAHAIDIDGQTFQKWVQISVSPDQREQFLVWHAEFVQRQRILQLGLGTLFLVSSVGGVHLVLARRQRFNRAVEQQATAVVAVPPRVLHRTNRYRGFLHKVAIVLSCMVIWSVVVYYWRARSPRKVSMTYTTTPFMVDNFNTFETNFNDRTHRR